MDGENNGKPLFLMDDLGGFPIIFGNTQVFPLDQGTRTGVPRSRTCTTIVFIGASLGAHSWG